MGRYTPRGICIYTHPVPKGVVLDWYEVRYTLKSVQGIASYIYTQFLNSAVYNEWLSILVL